MATFQHVTSMDSDTFHGAFAKRCDTEATVYFAKGSERASTFRQRWCDVEDLAESDSGLPDIEYHVPSLSDITSKTVSGLPDIEYPVPSFSGVSSSKTVNPFWADHDASTEASEPEVEISEGAHIVVKHTFIHLDYSNDALGDFLQERKVQSCPASGICFEEASVTASPDTLHSYITDMDCDPPLMVSDSDETVNSSCDSDTPTGSEEALFDAVDPAFDNASTSVDTHDSPRVPSNTVEAVPSNIFIEQAKADWTRALHTGFLDTGKEARSPISAVFVGTDPMTSHSFCQRQERMHDNELSQRQLCPDDRLQSLRRQGSAIQQRIETGSPWKQSPKSGDQQDGVSSNLVSSLQWHGVAPLPQEIRGSLQRCSHQPLAPPPTSPPIVNVARLPVGPVVSLPPPPPFEPAPEPSSVIQLAEAVAPPELGSPELPSIGSMMHHLGECKPCSFWHTNRCSSGQDCQFCHLCEPGEKKRRLRMQRLALRESKLGVKMGGRSESMRYSLETDAYY